ncbi:MAG: hypothetical protein JSV26_04830, partial [bacterium]
MNEPRTAMIPYWAGLIFAFAFAGVGTWSLMKVLNTHSFAEVAGTAWNLEGPLFRVWAFAVPFGSLLAAVGALVHVKANRAIIWAIGVGFPVIVVTTIMVYSARYYPGGFYGVGGISILVLFFSLVWMWMKRYAGQDPGIKVAGSLKLIGYLFWVTGSWYLCGDTAKLHLKAFEGTSVPSPTETMVFLVLGWFFVALGEYRSGRGSSK